MERTSMHHAVTDGSEGIDRRSYCRQLCLNRRWQGFLVLLKKIVGIGEIRVIEKVLQTRGAACPVSIVLVTGLDPRQQVSVAYENVRTRPLRSCSNDVRTANRVSRETLYDAIAVDSTTALSVGSVSVRDTSGREGHVQRDVWRLVNAEIPHTPLRPGISFHVGTYRRAPASWSRNGLLGSHPL